MQPDGMDITQFFNIIISRMEYYIQIPQIKNLKGCLVYIENDTPEKTLFHIYPAMEKLLQQIFKTALLQRPSAGIVTKLL